MRGEFDNVLRWRYSCKEIVWVQWACVSCFTYWHRLMCNYFDVLPGSLGAGSLWRVHSVIVHVVLVTSSEQHGPNFEPIGGGWLSWGNAQGPLLYLRRITVTSGPKTPLEQTFPLPPFLGRSCRGATVITIVLLKLLLYKNQGSESIDFLLR